jgi:1-acyl-sn-glycerol-3-phosphate acyltransferase
VNRIFYFLKFCVGFGIFGSMCVLVTPVLPLMYLGCGMNKKRYRLLVQDCVYFTFRFVFWYLKIIRFLDIEFTNRSAGQRSKLLVANHISMFDVVTVLSQYRHCNTFVNKKFMKNWVIAPIILSAGYIPVDPTSQSGMFQAMMKAMEMIEQGFTFVVFPEGTRSKSGQLGRFHPAVFRLAYHRKIAWQPLFITCDKPVFNNQARMQWTHGMTRFEINEMPARLVPEACAKKSELLSYVENVETQYKKWMQEEWTLSFNRQAASNPVLA